MIPVARYIPVIPVPYTEEDAREWLGGLDERRGQGEHAFAITPLLVPPPLSCTLA